MGRKDCLQFGSCSSWSLPCSAGYVDEVVICSCLYLRLMRLVLLSTKTTAATRVEGLRRPLFISRLTRKPILSAWPLRSGGFIRHPSLPRLVAQILSEFSAVPHLAAALLYGAVVRLSLDCEVVKAPIVRCDSQTKATRVVC